MKDTDFERRADENAEQPAPDPQATALQLESIAGKSGIFILTTLDGDKREFKAQTFPTFKTAQALQMLAKVKDEIDLVGLISEIQTLSRPVSAEDSQAQAEKVLAAFNAIPKLIEVAPDLLLDFASLAIIPNKELRQAYDDGTLDELRREKRKEIEFEFDASAAVYIFANYLPFVGLDFLRQAFSALNSNATKTLSSLT